MSQAMNIYAPRSQDGTIAFVAGLMAPWIFGFFITLVLLYVGGGALGYVYGTTTAAAISHQHPPISSNTNNISIRHFFQTVQPLSSSVTAWGLIARKWLHLCRLP